MPLIQGTNTNIGTRSPAHSLRRLNRSLNPFVPHESGRSFSVSGKEPLVTARQKNPILFVPLHPFSFPFHPPRLFSYARFPTLSKPEAGFIPIQNFRCTSILCYICLYPTHQNFLTGKFSLSKIQD